MSLSAQSLESYRWKNRVILLEASSESDRSYQLQLKALAGSSLELADRKVMVLSKIANADIKQVVFTGSTVDEPFPDTSDSIPETSANGFRVQLIGLDGGVKLDRKTVVPKQDFFDLIDAMPMRRSELEKKGN